jgi:cyclophilin family peptidyl-prolyl cis-trans isomerase
MLDCDWSSDVCSSDLVFGRVISGMQYVDAIAKGEPPEEPTKIVSAQMEQAGS